MQHESWEADDLTVRSRRSSRLFGRASRMRAKDFLSAGPAAMTGSQPSDMVVPLQQKTCTPTLHHQHHQQPNALTCSAFPAEKIQRWQSWFTLHHWAHRRQNSSQQFSTRVSPPSKNWTGIRPLRTWWELIMLHLHHDNSAQMYRFTAQQSSRLGGAFSQDFGDSLTSVMEQVADLELHPTESCANQKFLWDNTASFLCL